jgi:hypothetical protein
MNYKKLLQQSIDLHVHVGPDIIPRKFNLRELLKLEKNKLKGIAIKSHSFPIVAMTDEAVFRSKNPFIINSITINNYVGGFNAEIVRISAELSSRPIIVWFPTLHAECFLKGQKFEIAKEWVDPKLNEKIRPKLAKGIEKLSIFDKNGKIREEVKKVLKIIKKYNAVLATGHLSWQESRELVKYAMRKIGIKKVIITHPIYPKIDMPIGIQKELANLGAYIEQCYSMYSIDKILIEYMVKQIRQVSAKKCILSSDVGQTFSLNPSEALLEFIRLLKKEGINDEEIKAMLIINPLKLVR